MKRTAPPKDGFSRFTSGNNSRFFCVCKIRYRHLRWRRGLMLKKYLIFGSMIILTACSWFSNHSDLTFPEAEKAGYVVSGPGGLSNIGKLEEFHQNVQKKLKSQVRIARYTDEGDPIFID